MDVSDNTPPLAEQSFSNSNLVESLQVISSEIEKENFLENVIKVLVGTSDAYRIIFYSIKKNQPFIEAENYPGTNKCNIKNCLDVSSLSDQEKKEYFLSVIYEVIKAREPVCVENSSGNKEYSKEGYIVEKKPGSILCLPVIHDLNFTGVLYFEFDNKGPFSNELIEMLFTLARQVSIFFEHAEKYDKEKLSGIIRKEFLNSLFSAELGTPAEKVIYSMMNDSFAKMNMNWNNVLDSIKTEEWYWEYMSKIVMLKIKNEEFKRSLSKAEKLSRKKTESLVKMGNEIKITLNGLSQMLETIIRKKRVFDHQKLIHSMIDEIDTLKKFINDVFKSADSNTEIIKGPVDSKANIENAGDLSEFEDPLNADSQSDTISQNAAEVLLHYEGVFDDQAPMDYEQAIIEFEGSEEFLIEVMEGFIQNVAKQIETLRNAIENKNSELIIQVSSSIKGGADNLTAGDFAGVSKELEAIAEFEDFKSTAEIFTKLEKEFHRFKNFAMKKAQLFLKENNGSD